MRLLAILIMIAWTPQPGPQAALIKAGTDCFIDEVFYGGARGGGKTDGMLGDFGVHEQRHGRLARGIFFRRELKQLDDVIERAKELYAGIADYNEQKKTFKFRSGALLRFRQLDRDRDAVKYQGQAFTRVYFEELTNFPTDKPYRKLMACLRSAHGVPCGMRSTGNPGGVGHNWVKRRFITSSPPMQPIVENIAGKRWVRVFIPARLEDNPKLYTNDPMYEARLHLVGDAQLVKAWLTGNWDITSGGMFDDLWDYDTHVVRPFDIPSSWLIFRAYDWGDAKPFSVGWWARSDGTGDDEVVPIVPRNSMFRIAEWYGWNGQPNEGLGMTASDIARGIVERERVMGIHSRVMAGPGDMPKSQPGEEPMRSRFAREGASFTDANKLKAPGSRANGWQKMREMMKAATKQHLEDPAIFVFENCTDGFIRTIPTLPRDDKKRDDIDTEAEDHCADESRYALTYSPIDLPTTGQFAFGVN